MGLKKALGKTKKVILKATDFVGITNEREKSRYEYKAFKFYFEFLFYVFISVISLLLLLPYAYYLYSKKKVNRTYYDNKKLRFDGTISGAYIAYIQGFLLMIIILISVDKLQNTFLIDFLKANLPEHAVGLITTLINALPTILSSSLVFYGLFKWQQANTHFCYEQAGSFMERKIIKSVFVAIMGKLFGLISFGLGNPIVIWFRQRYTINRMHFSFVKMRFNGTIFASYKWFLFRYYLVIITFGLYYPIYLHRINEWIIIHTHCAG